MAASPQLETTFDPSDHADMTIHFKNHSFHMNSILLKRESRYFATALEAADKSCTKSDLCKSGQNHRCITLPESVGGKRLTSSTIEDLLAHLFNGGLLVQSLATEHDSKLYRFLSVHSSTIWLAFYFDCPHLLAAYSSCCDVLFRQSPVGEEALIDLLVLCDECHLDDLVTKTLIKLKETGLRVARWKKILQTTRRETLVKFVDIFHT